MSKNEVEQTQKTAAVIGAGRMGGHHARNYAGMKEHFQLVAIVDRNPEAAARLVAASPYMSPAEELRSKILAATAPASFKIEDYRKAMRDDSRVWRWAARDRSGPSSPVRRLRVPHTPLPNKSRTP